MPFIATKSVNMSFDAATSFDAGVGGCPITPCMR